MFYKNNTAKVNSMSISKSLQFLTNEQKLQKQIYVNTAILLMAYKLVSKNFSMKSRSNKFHKGPYEFD